jgi:hypothetical protein
MKKIIISLILVAVCFFVSGLFFLDSGIIDDNWELNEIRAVEISEELDKISFINTGEITFDSHGTLVELENFTVSTKKGNETFIHSLNISEFSLGDKVVVHYRYSSDYEKEVTSIVIK